MKPIEKIEAGAEQMYDEISQTITAKYNEIADDINELFMDKLRTFMAYSVALALLLGGVFALFIFLTYWLSNATQIPTWQAAGILGAVLTCIALLLFASFQRSKKIAEASEKLTPGKKLLNDAFTKPRDERRMKNSSPPFEPDEAMHKLKDGITDLISPTYHIKRNPIASVAVAIAAGTLFGMKKPWSKNPEPHSEARVHGITEKKHTRAHNSSGFFPATYALVAPLIMNAVQKKVMKGIKNISTT